MVGGGLPMAYPWSWSTVVPEWTPSFSSLAPKETPCPHHLHGPHPPNGHGSLDCLSCHQPYAIHFQILWLLPTLVISPLFTCYAIGAQDVIPWQYKPHSWSYMADSHFSLKLSRMAWQLHHQHDLKCWHTACEKCNFSKITTLLAFHDGNGSNVSDKQLILTFTIR